MFVAGLIPEDGVFLLGERHVLGLRRDRRGGVR
jgi:hypothetical protein